MLYREVFRARDWSGILFMPPLHGGINRYKRKARSLSGENLFSPDKEAP
jgi:hypothetical protein